MKRLMNVAHPMPQEFKSIELCLVVRTARRQDRCVPSNSYQDACMAARTGVRGESTGIPGEIYEVLVAAFRWVIRPRTRFREEIKLGVGLDQPPYRHSRAGHSQPHGIS